MPASKTAFVSLAEALRPRSPRIEPVPEAPAAAAEPLPVSPPALALPAEISVSNLAPVTPEQGHAIRAARLFRAAVSDACEALLTDLVREITVEIVARELRLAPVDVTIIARRLIADRFAEEPIRVRVAPADAAIACELPVNADPALEPGDAILECRSGSIDVRLGVRLAALLERLQP